MATNGDFPNSGILFTSERERRDGRDPSHEGTLDITCEHCGEHFTRKLAGWLKTSRHGRKFLTLSLKPRPTAKPAAPVSGDDLDFLS